MHVRMSGTSATRIISGALAEKSKPHHQSIIADQITDSCSDAVYARPTSISAMSYSKDPRGLKWRIRYTIAG